MRGFSLVFENGRCRRWREAEQEVSILFNILWRYLVFTPYFVNSFNVVVFSVISELKRRLKAQQKAKEKEAKEALKVIFVRRFVTVKHVVNVGFNFALTKALLFSGAKQCSGPKQEERWSRRGNIGSQCKLKEQALSRFFSSLHKPNTCALLFCAWIIKICKYYCTSQFSTLILLVSFKLCMVKLKYTYSPCC